MKNLIFFILFVFLICSCNAFAQTTENIGSYGFSVIQITDTQHLPQSYPILFDNLTKWIVQNASQYNVKMVIHSGDIVDSGSDTGQWANANASMSILLKNGIPYCWDAGNHDQIPMWDPNGNWLGGNYLAFNAAYMKSKPYWVSSISNGKDTAVSFTYGSYKFLVIDIEYFANQTVINWMKNLLNTHPDYNVIFATHDFIYSNGAVENAQWAKDMNNLLNQYPNVFLTLNGHVTGGSEGIVTNMTKTGNREEILWDQQEYDNRMGADSVRIYTFDMTDVPFVTCNVVTYDVYRNTYPKSNDPNYAKFMDFTFNFTLPKYCSGNVKLTLSPSLCSPSQTVTATVIGLSNCDGKNVYVLKTPTMVCSCIVSGTGCSCQFAAPNPYGTYTYTGFIDKNGDSSYESDETYSTSLTVTQPGGGCVGCRLLAIGPYVFNVDITPILSTVSAVLVLIEIVVLMTIYNRMKHTKRKKR